VNRENQENPANPENPDPVYRTVTLFGSFTENYWRFVCAALRGGVQSGAARVLFMLTGMEAHVAMVLMVRVNADATPHRLPKEFDAHEVVVADSIDEAMATSNRRAPDLILLPDTLSKRQKSLQEWSADEADGGAPTAQWIYWIGARHAAGQRSSNACEFLELVRDYLEPNSRTM